MQPERYAFSVPFRDLGPTVDEWRERTCVTKPSHGVTPHVTLLVPAPPQLDEAAEALAPFRAFDVVFTGFGRFPGTLWLAPQPSAPFIDMTQALTQRFPDHLPYDGEFEGIMPHLTVAQGEDLDAAEAALQSRLPLRSRASAVVLFEQIAPDRWRENAELTL
jgi:2'-5' RNA ligase